jgi:hypothetical protein
VAQLVRFFSVFLIHWILNFYLIVEIIIVACSYWDWCVCVCVCVGQLRLVVFFSCLVILRWFMIYQRWYWFRLEIGNCIAVMVLKITVVWLCCCPCLVFCLARRNAFNKVGMVC